MIELSALSRAKKVVTSVTMGVSTQPEILSGNKNMSLLSLWTMQSKTGKKLLVRLVVAFRRGVLLVACAAEGG